MKRILTAILLLAAVAAWAQDKGDTLPALKFKIDVPQLQLQPFKPSLTTISPNIVAPPTFNYRPLETPTVGNNLSGLSDEMRALPEIHTARNPYYYPVTPRYNFVMDPYGRDWSASGVIARDGNAYITASGSYTTLPAMGTIGSATVGFTGVSNERFTISAGVSGMKYHIDRDAWNDFGVYGNASYMLNERLSLNVFGQYYLDPRFHSIGSMYYMQNAGYGGTLNIKMSDNFGLDLGAQRYYDAYAHRWRTLPIVAPVINIFGQPQSFDVGGLIYELIDNLIENHRNKRFSGGDYGPWPGGRAPAGRVTPVDVNRRAAGGTVGH